MGVDKLFKKIIFTRKSKIMGQKLQAACSTIDCERNRGNDLGNDLGNDRGNDSLRRGNDHVTCKPNFDLSVHMTINYSRTTFH
jgi:hypothetical protein